MTTTRGSLLFAFVTLWLQLKFLWISVKSLPCEALFELSFSLKGAFQTELSRIKLKALLLLKHFVASRVWTHHQSHCHVSIGSEPAINAAAGWVAPTASASTDGLLVNSTAARPSWMKKWALQRIHPVSHHCTFCSVCTQLLLTHSALDRRHQMPFSSL